MDITPHISDKARKDLEYVRAAQQGEEKAFNILRDPNQEVIKIIINN